VHSHKTNIDLLRICAATAIVLSHTSGEFTLRHYDNTFINFIVNNYGFLSSGVDLFFVISGYVIMLSIDSNYKNPISFLKGRVRRIVPIYWMLTLLTVFFISITNFFGLSDISQPTKSKFFSSLLFTTKISDNAPPIIQQGWTLEFEMLFYAIVFLAMFCSRKKLKIIILVILILFLGLTDFYLILEFLGGIVVYLLYRDYKIKYLGLITFSIGFLLLLFNILKIIDFSNRLYFVFPYSFILFGLLHMRQIKGSLIIKLGQLSYPIYLCQGLVIPIVYQYIKKKTNFSLSELLGVYFLIIGLTFLISWFILKYFEIPISKKLKALGW
jgi:peptidoglycan/LPS O-acetylase OafA/YrhL